MIQPLSRLLPLPELILPEQNMHVPYDYPYDNMHMSYGYGYIPRSIPVSPQFYPPAMRLSEPHTYRRYPYPSVLPYPPLARIGQGSHAPITEAANGAPDVTKDTVGFLATIPQLLAVGIVAGAAFALGNGLVSRYVFKHRAKGG